MDFLTVTSLVGSVASIVALFLPGTRGQRVVHAVYVLAIALIAGYGQHYHSKWKRLESAERAAAELLKDQTKEYTSVGFSMAALAFFEKNKDLFPDSYARAQQLCEKHDCTGNKQSSVDGLTHAWAQNDAAFALAGLVKGIATLSKE